MEDSQRASSRKNRVYALHSFILQTYPHVKIALDVAGGRGDLSFLLHNFHNVDSIIADPRMPNFARLLKSIEFLLQNPKEAKRRAIEGLSTYQPLARCVSSLMEGQMCIPVGAESSNEIAMSIPRNMRIHVDDNLVKAIKDVVTIRNGERVLTSDLTPWIDFWYKDEAKIASNKSYYGGSAPKQNISCKYQSNQVHDPRDALEAFLSLDLIVGFHPDQATEAAIDLAIFLRIPFAVVPCCVFPSEFPNRTYGGKTVKSYNEFLSYLLCKNCKIRRGELSFVGSDTAKNVVLYMLLEDFEVQSVT